MIVLVATFEEFFNSIINSVAVGMGLGIGSAIGSYFGTRGFVKNMERAEQLARKRVMNDKSTEEENTVSFGKP
jgi:hypothetical protein